MNKKGQALVEFVIIVPIIILMLFALIDFGLIFYNKNKLESKLNDTALMISNSESEENIDKFLNQNETNKIKYNVYEDDKYKTIEIYTNLKIITPGLNKVLDNPYKVSVKRVIYEQ